jgi:uncharacterized tellurite resistance protein B-like protein
MIETLKELFFARVQPATRAGDPEQRERALRLAAAALLFEVVRADGLVQDEERTVMRAALQSTFGLEVAETDELVRLAEEQSRRAPSLYEFTHLIDAQLEAEQKKRLVELLWLVAFADARKDVLEEALVRQIAGLLHVPHPDFIDAKIRARRQAASGPD